MRRQLSLLAAAVLVLAVAVAVRASAPRAQDAPAPVQQQVTATCTFTNPSFSGKCVENAPVDAGSTAGKACGEILSCLNNPMCTKTYCSATTIRTNWKLESAVVSRR
jgi:hypothetical protein